MRWSGQTVGAEQRERALLGMSGLVRSVRTPEFAGVTFHEVTAKSALNRVPAASSMPFEWTVNPYRGCSHACVYCFARSTHRQPDLDAGADFDQQVVVKVNVDEVRRARGAPGAGPVALGTNTDPYQRAEGRYRLMPGIISALADSGTPLSIPTKGTLPRRDLPQPSPPPNGCPWTCRCRSPFRRRTAEGRRTGHPEHRRTPATCAGGRRRLPRDRVPHADHARLTDSDAQLDEALARIAEAGADRVVHGALHLRPGAKEWFLEWIAREHPELATGYRRFYGSSSYAPAGYRRNLAQRLRPLLRRHGLASHEDEDQPEQRRHAADAARRARTAPAALDLAPQPALF